MPRKCTFMNVTVDTHGGAKKGSVNYDESVETLKNYFALVFDDVFGNTMGGWIGVLAAWMWLSWKMNVKNRT